jgi:hypothetical protein
VGGQLKAQSPEVPKLADLPQDRQAHGPVGGDTIVELLVRWLAILVYVNGILTSNSSADERSASDDSMFLPVA